MCGCRPLQLLLYIVCRSTTVVCELSSHSLFLQGRPVTRLRTAHTPWVPTRPGTQPEHSADIATVAPQAINCDVLQKVVLSKHFLPKYWYVPFNPVLPPPLEQLGIGDEEQLPRVEWGDHLTHCSLQLTVNIMAPFGYLLVQVDHTFAIFKHASVKVRELDHPLRLKSALEHWLDGWYCQPQKKVAFQKLEYNFLHSNDLNLYHRARFYFADFVLRKTALPEMYQKLVAPTVDHVGKGGSSETKATESQQLVESFPALYEEVVRRTIPAKFYRKNPGPGVRSFLEQTGRGRCLRRDPKNADDDIICECFTPFRGPLCEQEQLRSPSFLEARPTNPNKHVIYYLLDHGEEHLWELDHALKNLWEKFNRYHDYPVVIWHVGVPENVERHYANFGGISNLLTPEMLRIEEQKKTFKRSSETQKKLREHRQASGGSFFEEYLETRAEEQQLLEKARVAKTAMAAQIADGQSLSAAEERRFSSSSAAEGLSAGESLSAAEDEEKGTSGRTPAAGGARRVHDEEPAPLERGGPADDEEVLRYLQGLRGISEGAKSPETRAGSRVIRMDHVEGSSDNEEWDHLKDSVNELLAPGEIVVSRKMNRGKKLVGADVKQQTSTPAISLLEIIAKTKNRVWLHLREKPELPLLSGLDNLRPRHFYPMLFYHGKCL